MKHLPNLITALRFLGALGLLFFRCIWCRFLGVLFRLRVERYGGRIHGKKTLLLESIVPMVIIAVVATFAAVQEGHLIRTMDA